MQALSRQIVPAACLALCARFCLPLCLAALLAGSASLHAQAGQNPPATFSLNAGEPSASVNGLWRFKAGDDPRFAQADFNDSDWALLRSDESWTQQGYSSLAGFGWYRFRLVLPAGAGPMSLLLPEITSGYQCFVDGKPVHTEGAVDKLRPARYSMPAVIDLPAQPLDPAQPTGHAQAYTVALRVWFDPKLDGSSEGGPDGEAVELTSVGDSATQHRRLKQYSALRQQAATVMVVLSLLFILAGITCFPLFAMERSHLEYLWYGIAASSYGLSLGAFFTVLTIGWPISGFLLVSSLFDAGICVGLVLFFSHLLRIRRNWLVVLVILLTLVQAFSSPLQDAGLIGSGGNIALSALGGCVFSLWVILAVVRRASQRVLDAMLLVAPVTFDFGMVFVESLRVAYPRAAEPVETLAQHVLWTYPFVVRVRNLSAAFVLLALVLVLLNRFARIRREHERITADMRAASSVQHLLIPDVLPSVPGLKIEAAYHPAQEVGGDFFQVMPVGSNKTLIVLGDVSGKGLPAAMTVSLVVGVLRTLVEFTTSPGAILAGLNTRLVGRGTGFTTCLAMEIAADGTLVFANAGQLAPYRNGVEIPSEAGLPLGILPGLAFPESTLKLIEGDRLTLMTDGIPEAASHRELFGFTRTEELSRQSAVLIADAARRFGQTDDITVLSIDYCGAAC
jgi:hypothetical protein